MTMKNDGGQAFPHDPHDESGMLLRDWFAGQALSGMLTVSKASSAEQFPELFRKVSELSYQAADAMLAAREK